MWAYADGEAFEEVSQVGYPGVWKGVGHWEGPGYEEGPLSVLVVDGTEREALVVGEGEGELEIPGAEQLFAGEADAWAESGAGCEVEESLTGFTDALCGILVSFD